MTTHSGVIGEVVEGSEGHGRLLRYGCDITLDDVASVESFLKARTMQFSQASRGSGERQMARAVRGALHHLVVTLRHFLPYSDNGGEAQSLARLQVHISWNALWALVSSWQWHEDYDQERWCAVKYWDSGQKAEFERRLTE
ncbi:hypothetical protein ACFYUL_33305 [Streptomyces sp. NPDC004311]|uniref:hypothetical protein n=1 Tax=Streptomyces sp. NPDC004311 TaxID=3364698 RepID=UPI00369656A7